MAQIKWSNSALNDIRNIAEFIEKDSISYSKLMIDKLFKAISRLEVFPRSGKIFQSLSLFEILEIFVSPYRVLYSNQNDIVIILAIVHQKQDL